MRSLSVLLSRWLKRNAGPVKPRSKYWIVAGFLLTMLLLVAITVIGLLNMAQMSRRMDEIVHVSNVKLELVTAMRTAARERAVAMFRMLLIEDPFELDEEVRKFSQGASRFIELRDRFMQMPLSVEERLALNTALQYVRYAAPLQSEGVSLILAGRIEEARHLLVSRAIPAQEQVFAQYDQIIAYQRKVSHEVEERIRVSQDRSQVTMLSMGLFALLVGGLASVLVVRRSSDVEAALSQEKEKAETTLNAIGDGVVSLNAEGRVEYMNPAAEQLCGWTAAEAVGRPLTEVTPVLDADRGKRLPMRHELGGGHDLPDNLFQCVLIRRDGAHVPIHYSMSVVRNALGDVTGYVMALRDISELMRAEQALKELNASLEARVLERTRAFQDANANLHDTIDTLRETQDQLIQAEKMASLGSLVAGISHEINTPIGVAVTSASTLQEEVKVVSRKYQENALRRSDMEQFMERVQQAADILLRNLERASALIGSFKQVAVDQSSDDWRDIDLHAYMDEILVSLRPKLKHTRIVVENACQSGLMVYTNPGAIYQVFSNFIINSLLHGFDEGDAGVIRIDAWREGERLIMEYTDNGKGIPAEYQGRIFDPFFTTRRGQGGSGLGLNIVYNLIKTTLNGQVAVASQPGEGVRFRLTLPLKAHKDAA